MENSQVRDIDTQSSISLTLKVSRLLLPASMIAKVGFPSNEELAELVPESCIDNSKLGIILVQTFVNFKRCQS